MESNNVAVTFALDPVFNTLDTLDSLATVEHYPRLGASVRAIVMTMPPELVEMNRLLLNILHVLYHRGDPDAPGESFPTYIEAMAAMSPSAFRDLIIDRVVEECLLIRRRRHLALPAPTAHDLLASAEAYLYWLNIAWTNSIMDGKLNLEAHRLLNNADELHHIFVTHMRTMWDSYLRTDWELHLPFLEQCVAAYQRVDFTNLDIYGALYRLVGRPRHEFENVGLDDATQVTFIPNMHIGSYVGRFGNRERLRITFPARLPSPQ